MDRRRTDTRARIRSVALELFTDQGYDKTSMREIAERLGVTKAALYHHFPSKQDIVTDLFASLPEGIEEIITWAGTQRPGKRTREQILVRYGSLLHEVGREADGHDRRAGEHVARATGEHAGVARPPADESNGAGAGGAAGPGRRPCGCGLRRRPVRCRDRRDDD